jgi:ribulose 1,5-bisphosphate carboxylase large subunit-like protein
MSFRSRPRLDDVFLGSPENQSSEFHRTHTLVTYDVGSDTEDLIDTGWKIAIGQSVGNPEVRNLWESDELFRDHACKVMASPADLEGKLSGKLVVAFPSANLDMSTDGVSQFLCHVMGGQMDIDTISRCRVNHIQWAADSLPSFQKPKFGLSGARRFTGCYNKPLLGGIVKPKVGMTPEQLLDMVKEMVEGGVNFIKEDEIMSNPAVCPLEVRVPLIARYLQGKPVVYAFCINSDPGHLLQRVARVHELGGNGVHINVWSGLGSYKSVRELDLPIFVHFQKSGDKVFTDPSHRFGFDWAVICDLAAKMGVDFLHAGMYGGYLSDDDRRLEGVMNLLREQQVVPALSCGMHPGVVSAVTARFGVDYLANVGGALHGHPGGTLGGTKAMRQAIDSKPGDEYYEAITKWGLRIVEPK